jgi:hypothetical protein
MNHVTDAFMFLKVFCANENDRNIFLPDISLSIFTIGVVPLTQVRIGT